MTTLDMLFVLPLILRLFGQGIKPDRTMLIFYVGT